MREPGIPFGERRPLGELSKEPHTIEAFKERWGNCGFEGEQLAEMWAMAQRLSSDLDYHDFEHTLDTLWAAIDQVDRLETDGFSLNRKVLVGAALFHDVKYSKPSSSTKPSRRERRSARLFRKHAQSFGFSETETELGYTVIRDTYYARRPRTDESKVLIRADLNNLGTDYENGLLPNTRLLYQEAKQSNPNLEYSSFVKTSVTVLTRYLSKDLSLGPNDKSYPVWYAKALANVHRLAQSIEGYKIPGKLAKLIGETAVREA